MKKFFILALSLLMALSLVLVVGCQKKEEATTEMKEKAAETAGEVKEKAAETAEKVPAPAKKKAAGGY